MEVMVICSAGNLGPDSYTVYHTAPWILTVAASSIDREFQSRVMLGNRRTIKGSAIKFSNLTPSKMYPLVLGEDVAINNTLTSDTRNCIPRSLDSRKASKRLILVVESTSNQTISRRERASAVESAKAKGLILVDES